MGTSGDTVVAWSGLWGYGGVHRAQAAFRTAGEPWGLVEQLSDPADSLSAADTYPNVATAVNSSGAAVGAWDRFDGSHYRVQVAERPASGTWSVAQFVSTPGVSAHASDVALNDQGDAVVTWVEDDPFDAADGITYISTRPAGGQWQLAEKFSPLAPVDGALKLWLKPDGTTLALWLSREPNGERYRVHWSERPADGAWGADHELPDSTTTYLAAAGDDDGNLTVVMMRDGRARVVERSVDGSWTPSQDLSQPLNVPVSYVGGPDVAVNGRGDALVAWVASNGKQERIQVTTRAAGGWWSAPEYLSSGPRDYDPSVALDGLGNPYVAWAHNEPGIYRIQATSRCRSEPAACLRGSNNNHHATKRPFNPDVACADGKLRLLDVRPAGRRVRIYGVAPANSAGNVVEIFYLATGKRVASVTVRQDLSFRTSVEAPSGKVAHTSQARYQARFKTLRSENLKLHRRLNVTQVKKAMHDRVLLTGRATRPLPAGGARIRLRMSASCLKLARAKVVTTFKTERRGSFRILVTIPKKLRDTRAIYLRADSKIPTMVGSSRVSKKLVPTFSLPRSVRLK